MKTQMIIYDIIYLAFSILCIALYTIFDKKTKKIQPIDIIIILMLVIISGIRCNCGSDYYSYYIAYNNWLGNVDSIHMIIEDNSQFGLYVISFLLKTITDFPYAIFWMIAVIIYPTMIIYMRKTTRKAKCSIYVLYVIRILCNI